MPAGTASHKKPSQILPLALLKKATAALTLFLIRPAELLLALHNQLHLQERLKLRWYAKAGPERCRFRKVIIETSFHRFIIENSPKIRKSRCVPA